MKRQWLIPGLGGIGLLVALAYSVTYGKEAVSEPHYLSLPPVSPYAETVWGSGIIEASSRNISIGSFRSGIVSHVFVTEGDEVKKGAPLFGLDDRTEQAQYQMRVAATDAAAAAVKSAAATLGDRLDDLRRLKSLKAGVEVAQERLQQAVFAAEKARSDWKQAKAQLEMAQAEENDADVTLDEMTVDAPISGRIMKINLSPGEYVVAGATQDPLILMGKDKPLYLRVNIDESDLWRFDPKEKATASLRDHSEIKVPLAFVRTEPYVMPKQQLDNLPGERVDTRVLQIIYRIDTGDPRLFIGQQMDVCIRARPAPPGK
jgi:HlyD family secretion protein